MPALAGGIADPGQYLIDTRRTLARGSRTTASSASTGAEVEIMALEGIPVTAGRLYKVYTSPLIFDSNVAADMMEVYFRYAIGSSATTASTKLASYACESKTASGVQFVLPFICDLPIAVTGTLSLLMSIIRTAGTGSCRINSSGAYPINLVIEDAGPDPGNTGISL